jgi:hypothetical protein
MTVINPLLKILFALLVINLNPVYAQHGDAQHPATSFGGDAQNSDRQKVTCYYLSLKSNENRMMTKIPDYRLCLEYQSNNPKQKYLDLYFYDWKQQEVGTHQEVIAYGINSFSLDLLTIGVSEPEDIYILKYSDGYGNLQTLPFKIIPSEQKAPEVEIQIQPVSMPCKEPTGHLVELYGRIYGGKPPYTVDWQVLAEDGQTPLYQPRREYLEKAGFTPMVNVEAAPVYYVSFSVKDACGETNEQIVSISCEEELQKNHSVFIKNIQEKVLPKVDGTP